jgi:hypothetical protein
MARPTLAKHPKFLRLCAELRRQRWGGAVMARGVLETLWDITYESGDGCLGSADDVELFCEWPGDAGELVRMLRDAGGPQRSGFIEQVDGRYYVHDLFDHCPEYVKKRHKREQERHAAGEELQANHKPKRLVQVEESAPVNNGKRSPRSSRRCPAEFELAPASREFGLSLGLTAEEVEFEFATFKDYEFKPPGHSDWEAAWKNWCRKEVKDRGARRGGRGRSTSAENQENIHRFLEPLKGEV